MAGCVLFFLFLNSCLDWDFISRWLTGKKLYASLGWTDSHLLMQRLLRGCAYVFFYLYFYFQHKPILHESASAASPQVSARKWLTGGRRRGIQRETVIGDGEIKTENILQPPSCTGLVYDQHGPIWGCLTDGHSAVMSSVRFIVRSACQGLMEDKRLLFTAVLEKSRDEKQTDEHNVAAEKQRKG